MKYYLVVNEWNYPDESGRDFVGDYDSKEEAFKASEKEYNREYDIFLEVNKGEIYSEACGESDLGYILNSSKFEEENMYFLSRVIEIETLV
jgi:hypothetical protein